MQPVRDQAQFILGGISLVVWFVSAFALSIAWFVDEYTPQPIFMAGGVAFLIAALPWLAYPALLRHLRKRSLTPSSPGSSPPSA